MMEYKKGNNGAVNNQSVPLPEGGLLQSRYWAEVLRSEGKKVLSVRGSDGEEIYCTKHKLPVVGEYIYCPRAYNLTMKDVEKLLTDENIKNAGWLRLDIKDKKLLKESQKKYDCQQAPHNMQPRQNFIIDIGLSEEELLAGMKSKTRYNIRLAKKKGVEILVTREQKYIDEFINLVEQTAQRKGVSFHQRKHYEQMFKNIPEDVLQLYVAKYEGEVVAANIISFYGGVATYLHGATADKHRNVMAPFLLQWQAILDAKERGLKHYDFGGVKVVEANEAGPLERAKQAKGPASSERTKKQTLVNEAVPLPEQREGEVRLLKISRDNNAPGPASSERTKKQIPINGPWQGITKFKLGFSPNTKPFQTIGSQDIILNQWKYKAYIFLQGVKNK